MPDLGPAIGGILEVFGPVVGAALKRLLRTAVGTLLFGALCLSIAGWLVINGWPRALVLLVPGVIGLVVMTGFLSLKNTVLGGVVHAVQRLGLGAKLVSMVFARLGVSEQSTHGERGGLVTQSAERLPLKHAEEKLNGVVHSLLGERAAKTGVRAWLARALMNAVLVRVQALTLARFREENAAHGGVDLVLVRRELGGQVDQLLASQVLAQLNRINLLIAGAYVVFVAVLAFVATKVAP